MSEQPAGDASSAEQRALPPRSVRGMCGRGGCAGEDEGVLICIAPVWLEENCLEGTKEDAYAPALGFVGHAHLITVRLLPAKSPPFC